MNLIIDSSTFETETNEDIILYLRNSISSTYKRVVLKSTTLQCARDLMKFCRNTDSTNIVFNLLYIHCDVINKIFNYINQDKCGILSIIPFDQKQFNDKCFTYVYKNCSYNSIKYGDITSLRIYITKREGEVINVNAAFSVAYELEFIE